MLLGGVCDVTASSPGDDAGATFTVRLPLQTALTAGGRGPILAVAGSLGAERTHTSAEDPR
jgi:hypothetical protein